MAYTIQFTNSADKDPIVIEDGTINNTTSLSFPGRNSTGYGAVIAEDLLHLLENFASPIEPSNGIQGQLWYNSTTGQLLVYDGTSWVPSGGLKKSTAQPDPTEATDGDLWVDTESQQLYLFSGSTWILVGPEFSQGLTTGAKPSSIIGQDNVEYTVIEIQVQANVVAIVAFNEFTPKATVPGFTVVKPGINLANRDTDADGINNVKFYGIAERAENLIVNDLAIPSANFLRGDVESTSTNPLNIQNNTGISYGINGEMGIGIEGSAGIIQHNIEGSNIDVRVRNAGASKTVLRVDSSLRIGVNNEAPDEALDVTGNFLTSGTIKTNDITESTTISNGSIIAKGGVGIAKSVNVGESIIVQKGITLGNNDLTVDTDQSDLIMPDLNNTRNIGSSTNKWRKMYATTFIGSLQGTVQGSVSGKSGSSDKLTSSTTFRLSGDVETVENVFDGQTGGAIKDFNVSIKNTIISGKTQVTDSLSNDEFIIDRISGSSTGLRRISRQTLFQNIAGLSPIGSIMPFAGAIEPTASGWWWCNGQELSQGAYNSLFQLIGFTYKAQGLVTAGSFALPDLRGRFPLGSLYMGGTNPPVETPDTRTRDANATVLGAVDGSDDVSIGVNNLPEHEHDMRAENGTQFTAIRAVDGSGGDKPPDATLSKIQTGADSLSQTIDSSGGILSPTVGEDLNVMNPYQTINYIIYTGVVN
jgi:microcystin-dependent protein